MTNYIFPLANKLIINAGHLLVSLSFKLLFQCMLLLSHIQLISLLTKMKCSRLRKPEVLVLVLNRCLAQLRSENDLALSQ